MSSNLVNTSQLSWVVDYHYQYQLLSILVKITESPRTRLETGYNYCTIVLYGEFVDINIRRLDINHVHCNFI